MEGLRATAGWTEQNKTPDFGAVEIRDDAELRSSRRLIKTSIICICIFV